ncbi:MAG: hypothetical protein C4523_01540 [Myxococcales bacterium]|nr:MAG: hypothetical protein C4523_01540 [Myxococcales bacterium]
MKTFKGKSLSQNYYDLLEVGMGADEEEIRRAYDRIKQIYSESSLATYGLYTPNELREFRERVEQAFRVLIDAENRREYDKTLMSEPVKKAKRLQIAVAAKEDGAETRGETASQTERANAGSAGEGMRPAAVQKDAPGKTTAPKAVKREQIRQSVPEDAKFTGPYLAQLREQAGIDLHEISAQTKMSINNLRMIEAEAWGTLPALVYLRSFIIQYARYLGLDEKRVLADLLVRYREARGPDAD